jgi:hypothetical protein
VELFGIVFSIPVAFVMSMAYCAVLAHAIRRIEGLRRWLYAVSLVVLAGFLCEVVLLATLGAVAEPLSDQRSISLTSSSSFSARRPWPMSSYCASVAQSSAGGTSRALCVRRSPSAWYYCSTVSPRPSTGSLAQMALTVSGVTSNTAVQETGARDARPGS